MIDRLKRIGYRLQAFLLPVAYCLLPIGFYSCGNGTSEKEAVTSNDSTPADIRAINDKINSDRNNADLYLARAKAHFAHKEYEPAIGDMKIALNIDSSKAGYYLFLSDMYFTQNRSRETRNMLRKAIALDSTNVEALMKYSQLFYLLRQYDTAIFYINRTLHFDRANSTANFQKGMILKEAGDTVNSISSFQSSVELDPERFDAYMQLGILFSMKKNPMALQYFTTALKINPQSVEALYGKGKFYQDMKDYDNALKTYEDLLVISPGHQDAVFNTGAIYFEQKKYNDALQKFELTLKRDGNFYRGYYGRGRAYEALGEKQKAIDDYKQCLAIKPDYSLATIQLGIISKGKK